MRSSHVAVIGLAWLALAVAVGAAGLLADVRPPLPQVILVGLTVALVLAGVFVRPFREWLRTVDLRVAVAFHLTRFVGVYFLILYARGELPYSFAVPAGYGDIVVAVFALGLLLTTRPEGPWGRRLYLGWNVLGLIDILGVVAAAVAAGVADPESMRPLAHLPLNLLITFIVPVIIASHLLVFVRLLGGSPGGHVASTL